MAETALWLSSGESGLAQPNAEKFVFCSTHGKLLDAAMKNRGIDHMRCCCMHHTDVKW